MDQAAALNRLKTVLTEILGEEPDAFGIDVTLDALGLDSVERVELLGRLEDEFELTIPPADAIHLSSVESLVRYLIGRRR